MTDNNKILPELQKVFFKDQHPTIEEEGAKIVNAYLIYRTIRYIEQMELAINLIKENPAGKIVFDELKRSGKIKC